MSRCFWRKDCFRVGGAVRVLRISLQKGREQQRGQTSVLYVPCLEIVGGR